MLHILWGSSQHLNTEAKAKTSSITFTPEGSTRAFLTDPQIVLPEPSDVKNNEDNQTWGITKTQEILKTKQLFYWCSIKKAPGLSSAHNIIGVITNEIIFFRKFL